MRKTNPVGRPKKEGETLSIERPVKFAPSMYEKLQETSAKEGISIAEQIRRAVKSQIYPSGSDTTGLTPVKILGSIPAGAPSEQVEYENKELICSLHPSGENYFYVHVEGDSMDRIVPSGAFALVRKMWAMPGSVIAAKLTMPDGAIDVTLKKLRVGENNEITLEPCSHNDSHQSIMLSETKPRKKDVVWLKPECGEILGVFTGDYVVVAEK